MTSLNAILQTVDHVVAQVVETEFVVGPVRDVALVDGSPFGGPGLGGVEAADGQAEELEHRAHPLGVTPRQIVVHRDQVSALGRQRVEVEWQRGHQRLPLTGRHLGDLALVQDDATDQLHVVGDHVPLHVVAPHPNVSAKQAPACLAHRGVGLGKELVEHRLPLLPQLSFELSDAQRHALALQGLLGPLLGFSELGEFVLERLGALPDDGAEFFRLRLQLFVVEILEICLVAKDLIDDRLDLADVTLELRAEDRCDYLLDHATRGLASRHLCTGCRKR